MGGKRKEEEGRQQKARTEVSVWEGDVGRTGKLPISAPVTRTWQTISPSGKIQAEGEELHSTQREGSPGVSSKQSPSRSREEEFWGKLRKQREGQHRPVNLTSASGTTSCLQNCSLPWVTLPLSLPFQNLPIPTPSTASAAYPATRSSLWATFCPPPAGSYTCSPAHTHPSVYPHTRLSSQPLFNHPQSLAFPPPSKYPPTAHTSLQRGLSEQASHSSTVWEFEKLGDTQVSAREWAL